MIITVLRGVALQTVMSNNHEDVASILRTLREAFVPKNQAISLRNDLMTLKQKGNDFQTFLFSFNTFLAQVREADQQTGNREMNENEAITYFVKGLPPPTQSSILMKHPRTLKDAIQIATDHEQVYLHARVGQPSNSSSHVTMDLDQVDDDYGEYDEFEDDNDANNVAGMRFHRKHLNLLLIEKKLKLKF